MRAWQTVKAGRPADALVLNEDVAPPEPGPGTVALEVLAANTVVLEGADIPDRCVVAGVPGVIKKRLEGSAAKWIESNPGTDNYLFSKQAMSVYVARESFRLLRKGIRLNAVLPGPTDTPLARANADVWLTFGEPFRKELGVDPLTPEQIGDTLVFLCSDAASGINGSILVIDYGHANAAISGAYEDPAVKGLLGLS